METKSWSIHGEFLVLLITLIGGFYLLDGKIERQCQRVDELNSLQAARSDKLYEMFIDLIKEGRK